MTKDEDNVPVPKKAPCELAAYTGRVLGKCCGMNDCDRMVFFEFLQAFGQSSPDEQKYMMGLLSQNIICPNQNPPCPNQNPPCPNQNIPCPNQNLTCASLNQICSALNQLCASLNIYGPDQFGQGTEGIMTRYGVSLCELVKTLEIMSVWDEIQKLPDPEQKALRMMMAKAKGIRPEIPRPDVNR